MHKKHTCTLLLFAVLLGFLVYSLKTYRVEAQLQTIYIRANGDIEPSWVPIQRNGDLYTFTGDIIVDGDATGMVIERDNMTLDGAGYSFSRSLLTAQVRGIELTGRTNVTIRNVEISAFVYGIRLDLSSTINMTNNNITNTEGCAIYLWNSSDNMVVRNILTSNKIVAVYMSRSSNNSIRENTIVCNGEELGFQLHEAHNNSLLMNNITGSHERGIGLAHSNHTAIYGNIIFNSSYVGINLGQYSAHNEVIGNNITNCRYGIRFGYTLCSDNIIQGNTVTGSVNGISLYQAPGNNLSGNIVENCSYSFDVTGYELTHFMNLIDTSNLVDGKPVYYYVNQTDLVVDPATHPQIGYLALVNCRNIIVENQTLTGNRQGLLLAFSNDSCIRNNQITINQEGIRLSSCSIIGNNITSNEEYGVYADRYSSHITILRNNIANSSDGILTFLLSNTTISENTIAENTYGINANEETSNCTISRNTIIENNVGVYLSPDYPLHLYHNNFINNTQQLFLDQNINHSWDNGLEGNYWSNYTGTDVNRDGIGDSWHEIGANNIAHYPLKGSFHSFNTSTGKSINVIYYSTADGFGYESL